MRRRPLATLGLLSSIVLGCASILMLGCASTSPRAALDDVQARVHARTGHDIRWDTDVEEDARVRRAVDTLLERPLTVDSSVQIALMQSPHLRATLEELALAQADLVQAGLLSNPVLTLGRTAWEQEHIAPNLFGAIEASFLDLVTVPLKKRVAGIQLEASKLTVASEVLALAADVRAAYYRALAAQQVAGLRALVREAAEAGAELARRQHASGTRNDLALSAELGFTSQARLDETRSLGDAAEAREELGRTMGLWGARARWTLPPRLPELPTTEIDVDHLEESAVEARFDLGAARRQLQAVGAAITLAKTTRWTGTVNVGLEAGRLRGSKRFSFGPSVGIEIPLFDQRQAAIARLEAVQRQAQRELEALAIDVRAEVRSAAVRVLTARKISEEYTLRLVPARESNVRYSQQHYDAMLLGVYQLLLAKQAELDTYRETIEAQRDYWVARSSLERALGARVPERAVPNGG